MKRLALTALALASTALSGAAFADDYYNDQGSYRSGYEYNGNYGDNNYGNSGGVRYDSARVLSVDPVIDQNYSQARRECWTVSSRNNRYDNRYYTNNYRNRRSGNNTGAVLGGIVGAAIGNQVGDGDGRRAATVAGAVLGYAIARDVQNNRGDNYRYSGNRYDSRSDQYGNGYYTEPNGQLRCRMVNDDQYGYGYQNNRYDNSSDYRYGRDRYVNERYQDRYNHERYDNRYDNARVTGYRVTFEYHGQVYTTVTDYHPGNNIRVRINVEADGNEIGYGDRDYRDDRYARY
ncbi:MAG: glycine zipper 2TM domain-containing protein [Arenimonas sp.]